MTDAVATAAICAILIAWSFNAPALFAQAMRGFLKVAAVTWLLVGAYELGVMTKAPLADRGAMAAMAFILAVAFALFLIARARDLESKRADKPNKE